MRLVGSSPAALERALSRYRDLDLTYPERGATAGPLPAGYHRVARRAGLGHGRAAFERAAGALLTWQAQRGAGLRLAATAPEASTGVTVVMCAGPGPFGVLAPCRVVWTLQEPDRRGFAYGTLPDHPVRGEESFVVERDSDGGVWLDIVAFSRPNGGLPTLGGPVGRQVQRVLTDRYLDAMRELASR
ncbi:hypothetical protein UG55_100947 [Frankia sp. EI5c]|uniref:DUF1990 family protein n=1 Tax=Frankia sp. EI5c TaxID=683316 RepID=UPI0007C2D6FB|nr:DUF1990 domain-containing protein [Frankia sp. EI5c]OAA27164.1 hypothetical protein UG55_100947 [Frankia sp. EI5c]